ncbi:stage II sporulation protein M [Marinilabiliaceae bacterium JC017]|nr:stage II sporulation protein M [Marinilabiliaceae bacterium JC017]
MKEITFINRNKARWERFEAQLKKPSKIDPDELADQFIQLTDDLSYARTFYAQSHTLTYLNGLTMRTHQEIYRNKRENGNRIIHLFKEEIPLVMHENRKYFLFSLVFFLLSVLLGVVSSLTDDSFVRLILGDAYVNMTLDNIEKGDPMAVYGQMSELPMFLTIALNNIRVSFILFLFGLATPIGTLFGLFRNGIMVGAFQTFFYQKNLLGISSMAIMIHGTLELSAIVIAGGAGIILGKSILFPGSYPRKTTFMKGVKDGSKVMLGLVPIFTVAGFLEGFVTRAYGSMSTGVNIFIIAVSLVFIVWYFFIYPEFVHKKTNLTHIYEV